MDTEVPLVREAVGVFHDVKALQAAIYDLETHGFDRAEISLLAPVPTVEKDLGHAFRSVRELEDDTRAPMVAYTSPESVADAEGAIASGLLYVGALASLVPVVASGGSIAAAMIAMTVGGGVGASIGAVLANLFGKQHAKYIEDQLDRGGLLLWVRTWNAGDEKRAVEILSEHSGEDVHVHAVPETDMDLDTLLTAYDIQGEKKTYGGEAYVQLDEGAYFAAGKVFPSEAAVKRYIDRSATIAALSGHVLPSGLSFSDAMTDPASAFGTLETLMDTDLSAPFKAELLKRWAYDVKQQQRATGEGMPADNHCVPLPDIEQALQDLAG